MESIDPQWTGTIFVHRWPWYIGGVAIGTFVVVLLLGGGRMLGVSTGFQDACSAPFDAAVRRSWRLPFLLGIVGGGLMSALLSGGIRPTATMGMFDILMAVPLAAKAVIFIGGGVLIGFGTRLAGGCTSGHGIIGTAQLAPASLIATFTFMASGFAVTHAAWALLAG